MNVIDRQQLINEYIASGNALIILAVAVGIGLVIAYNLPTIRRGRLPKIKMRYLVAGGVLIRLVMMLDSAWYDEAFTGAVARVPLAELHRVVISDVHPPTWYALSHIVGSIFGYGDFALRLPALGFGLMSIVLAYLLARSVTNQRTAMMTVIILLYLPNHIFYSAEARQYTLLACVVLLAILAIHRRISLIPVIGILPYIHSYGFLYMGILGAYAVIKHPKKLPLVAVSGLLGMTYLPIMLAQSSDVSNGFWLPDFAIGQSVTFITDMIGARVTPDGAIVPFAVAIGMTLWALWRWRWRSWGVPLIAVGVPIVAVGLSLAWHNIYLVRALLPCQMLMVIIWANALSKTKSSAPIMAITGAVAVALVALIIAPDVHKPNWRGILTVCDEMPIFATSTSTAIIARHYSDEVLVWARGDDLNQTLSDDAKLALGLSIANTIPRPACVVQMTNGSSDRAQNAMTSNYDLVAIYDRYKRISRITVYEYQ